ncbi:MAG: DUF2339 domain-containing protein [Chthoniobacteraceae bacterium]
MNSADRFELDAIRHDQDAVHRRVENLDQRIDLLVRRLATPPPLADPQPSVPQQPDAESRDPVQAPSDVRCESPADVPTETSTPPPLPPAGESFELRVGTFWMARVGIVILLTGLVFLGNYAYQRFIALLGPCGKLVLLTVAGAALAGLGAWLERKSESLRNYGRVLLAGGAATIYYTTYAAHFVERLRVIDSALIGGTLLLALAGGIMWFAERRRSEPTALMAVLLSYYTSAINPIGSFTLFSNLLLTGVAVFFLVRRQWTKLSLASLVATYGSYGFWQFQQGSAAEFGLGFLASYWTLFTVAVFLASPGVLRAGFLTLNNGVFFGFAAHFFAVRHPAEFWMFALGYGVVLLGLAALAARQHGDEPSMDGAYLAQGLALVTAGFAAKLTGPQFAVVLAVESGALLACARWRHGWLYQLAAGLCAIGAFGITLDTIDAGAASPLALGGTVAALLLANAWWVKFARGEWPAREFTPHAFGFAVLGLLLTGEVISHVVAAPWLPAAFALAALTGLLAARGRMHEIAWPAQGFALWGTLLAIGQGVNGAPSPWWTPLPAIATALVLMHRWQLSRRNAALCVSVQCAFAGAATVAGAFWLRAFAHGDAWLAATSAAAIGTLIYGLATRAWPVALMGQGFTACAALAFLDGLGNGHPHWLAALAPVLAMMGTRELLARVAGRRWPALQEDWRFAEIAIGYQVAGAVMFAGWSFEYVPAEWRVVYFGALGAAHIVAGSLWPARSRIVTGALHGAAAMVMFWMHFGQDAAWLDLAALIAVPASVRWGERRAGSAGLWREAHQALMVMVLASAWLWVTRWTISHGYPGHLTAAWAVLALVVFAAGLGLRERIHRLGGFAFLALAIGRLFVVDVWRFDTLYRIVSFLVLGVVLLALSFIYHRFAGTLRRWL